MILQRVPISEAAKINPRLTSKPQADELVSFVPMAAVSEITVSIESPVDRPFAEVAKGFTPFERGDVIVAKITPCFENGKMAHAVNLPRAIGVGSTEFHVLRPKSSLSGAYLFHMLRLPAVRTDGARKMQGAAGQRRVPADFFASLQIPLPPLAEQKRIARILDAADALRAKRREALAQLDALLQSTFLTLFGDPVTNPMGWEQLPFDACIDDRTSSAIKIPKSEYAIGGKWQIIDQSQNEIAGYSDQGPAFDECLPVVVFGDHTRCVKLIREPFLLGADGAKLLVPRHRICAVYLSYVIPLLKLPDLGYSRHMKEVKRLLYPIPPCERRSDSRSDWPMWNSGVERSSFLPGPFKNRPFFLLQRGLASDFQIARIIRRSRRRPHPRSPSNKNSPASSNPSSGRRPRSERTSPSWTPSSPPSSTAPFAGNSNGVSRRFSPVALTSNPARLPPCSPAFKPSASAASARWIRNSGALSRWWGRTPAARRPSSM